MPDYSCPNCGAPLTFRSSVSVYVTCTHCRSMVVRHDMNLKTLGQVAELLDDMSPFQVGTSGTFKGRHFYLLGRIKVVYEKGTWSEWYALFDDGQEGWLAEAQGRYMMTFPIPDYKPHKPNPSEPLSPYSVNGEEYLIEDIRQVNYVASEGELPFRFEPGREALSVDLRDRQGRFASLSFPHNQIATAYLGEYQEFEDFNFQYLRTLDGW